MNESQTSQEHRSVSATPCRKRDSKKERILQLTEEGWTAAAIAERLSTNIRYVYKVRTIYGNKHHPSRVEAALPRALTARNRAIVASHREGKSLGTLALRYGISKARVHFIIHRFG